MDDNTKTQAQKNYGSIHPVSIVAVVQAMNHRVQAASEAWPFIVKMMHGGAKLDDNDMNIVNTGVDASHEYLNLAKPEASPDTIIDTANTHIDLGVRRGETGGTEVPPGTVNNSGTVETDIVRNNEVIPKGRVRDEQDRANNPGQRATPKEPFNEATAQNEAEKKGEMESAKARQGVDAGKGGDPASMAHQEETEKLAREKAQRQQAERESGDHSG